MNAVDTPVESPKSVEPRSVAELDFTPLGTVTPSPRDWRDHVIYQLLVDRFDDGKDYPLWTADSPKAQFDPAVAGKFQGGTLKGITRRLDYIKGLGVTTIWVSPPFKNRQEDEYSAHGYAIQNWLAIDPRIGTEEDLRELVREAHARGMYVVLDIVINHSGDVWAYKDNADPLYDPAGTRYEFGHWRKRDGGAIAPGSEEKPGYDDAVWPVELQDPEAYKRRGRIRNMAGADLDEAVQGDFSSLKDLEIRSPGVIDALIKCHKWWIARADIDGFRMDTVKHADPEPTAIFCNAIREYAKGIGKDNFLIFGEVVDGDDMLKRYIAKNTPVEEVPERYPVLGAVLDFPLFFVLEEVIKGFASVGSLRDRYEHFRQFYRDFGDVGRHYVTFVDNHDQMSRPFRRFAAGSGDWRQSALAVGYLLCNMGIPCIYYGTEQGFDGAGKEDTAVRECMFGGPWGARGSHGFSHFDTENPIYKLIGKVAAVRAKEPALRYGREYFRDVSGDGEHFGPNITPGGIIAFSRVLDTEELVVVLNLDDKQRDDRVTVDGKLTPEGSMMEDLLAGGEPHKVMCAGVDNPVAFVSVPLAPRTMAILKRVKT